MSQRFILFLLAICMVFLSPFAYAKGGYTAAVSPTAAGFGIKFAKSGQPMATMNPSATGPGIGVAQSFGVTAKDFAFDAAATGIITYAAAAAGLGAMGIGITWAAAAALPAIKEWMDRAGVRVKADGGLEISDTSVCTVAPCFEYRTTSYITANYFPVYDRSEELACKRAYDQVVGPAYGVTGYAVIDHICHTYYGSGGDYARGFNVRSVDPSGVVYLSATSLQAVERMGASAPTVPAIEEMIEQGYAPEVAPVSTSGPASAGETNTVKLDSDGSKKTERCAFYLEYFPSNIKAHPECVTTTVTPEKTETKQVVTTNPDGSTVTSTVTTTTPGTTTTSTTGKDKIEQNANCGMPSSPPCVIDETGVPIQKDVDAKMDKDAPKKAQKDIDDIALDPTAHLPKLPVINWAFVLPTGCAVIPLQAFEPFLSSVDVCQFQPIFHDLFSVVWVLGGLFGAISLFMKSSLAD